MGRPRKQKDDETNEGLTKAEELTPNQLIFATEVLDGKTHEVAYGKAYPKSLDKTSNYRTKAANNLLRSYPHVRAYIEENRKKIHKNALIKIQRCKTWNLKKSVEALTAVINGALMDLDDAYRYKQAHPFANTRIVSSNTASAIINGVGKLQELLGDDQTTDKSTLAEKLLSLSLDKFEVKPKDYQAEPPATAKKNKDGSE